jgi:hypothetical protein
VHPEAARVGDMQRDGGVSRTHVTHTSRFPAANTFVQRRAQEGSCTDRRQCAIMHQRYCVHMHMAQREA